MAARTVGGASPKEAVLSEVGQRVSDLAHSEVSLLALPTERGECVGDVVGRPGERLEQRDSLPSRSEVLHRTHLPDDSSERLAALCGPDVDRDAEARGVLPEVERLGETLLETGGERLGLVPEVPDDDPRADHLAEGGGGVDRRLQGGRLFVRPRLVELAVGDVVPYFAPRVTPVAIDQQSRSRSSGPNCREKSGTRTSKTGSTP